MGIIRRKIWLGLAICLACCSGCSRPFWRSQADFDAYGLLFEKTADARWDVPRLTLESDPRSRIYDPYDPDLTPLPPDDPFANQYMHWVDGMQGYKSWHKFGQQLSVENPQWMNQFEVTPQDFGVEWLQPAEGEPASTLQVPTIANLTLEQAIELANINSREYQLQLENTYLAALALTFSRFQFNVRYLGLNGVQPTSNLTYINQPSTLDTLSYNNRFGVSQLLPTGGQWVAELANNTLWLFSTPGQTNSASILTYSLVQPLLTGAGRKVVLENLTLNERQVLYNIRTLARFRQTFFSNTVVNDTQGPGGYLGILSQLQQVDNTRFNLRELRIQIEKLQAAYSQKPTSVTESLQTLPDGLTIPEDLVPRLKYNAQKQVLTWLGDFPDGMEERLLSLSADRAYQRAIRSLSSAYRTNVITTDLSQLLTQEARLVTTLRSLESSLLDNVDAYKLILGLPTDFQITLDRSLLNPFELIDPRINQVENRLQQAISTWGDVDSADPSQERLREITEQLTEFWRDVQREGIVLVQRDLEREERNRPARLGRLPTEAARQQVLQNVDRDRLLLERNQDDYAMLGQVLAELKDVLNAPDLPLEDSEAVLREQELPALANYLDLDNPPGRISLLGALRNLRESLLQILQGLKVIQVGTRSELITLQDVDLSLEDATAMALENRLDLMNARAAVMDARRAMEVTANKMEGILNVVTRGDIRNTGGHNPFDFRADQSTFQTGLQFTAPLDQVQVRNNYRASLVAYQQARRAYMVLEDTIKLQVRQEWRQLRLQRANFETTRQNLRYSAIGLDVTIESTFQPSTAAASAVPQSGAGLRSAGQNVGLNILNALNNILAAQNSLIQIWVQYEQNRILIHQDMGMMEIDERGVWVDPVYQPASVTIPTLPSEPADVVHPAFSARLDRDVDAVVVDFRTEEASSLATPEDSTDDGLAAGAGVFRLTYGSDRGDRPAVPGQRTLRFLR